MDEPLDPKSVSDAERVSEKLVTDLSKGVEATLPPAAINELLSPKRYVDFSPNVPIDDVLRDLRRLSSEFVLAKQHKLQIACVRFPEGELAPISIRSLGREHHWFARSGEYRYREPPMPPRRMILEQWNRLIETQGKQDKDVEVLPYEKTYGGFKKSLSSFLAFRFQWRNLLVPLGGGDDDGGGVPPLSMLDAKLAMLVSCNTHKLVIHVSPAYFINWRFFGAPSPDVSGHVKPGRHVFAGEGHPLPRRVRDSGVFHTPPTYHATLTRF